MSGGHLQPPWLARRRASPFGNFYYKVDGWPAYSRVNANGKGLTAGKWWLPSMGELMMIYANMRKVNYALSLIEGATQLAETWYWSSTEYSATAAWLLYLNNGYALNTTKATYQGRVRAVSAFIY